MSSATLGVEKGPTHCRGKGDEGHTSVSPSMENIARFFEYDGPSLKPHRSLNQPTPPPFVSMLSLASMSQRGA